MTDSSATKERPLVKAAVIVLLAVGICLASISLLDRYSQLELKLITSGQYFWYAVLLQIVGLTLFVFAWYTLLKAQRVYSFSLIEASAHIGVTLVGKYFPGKIWGLVGRSYLLTKKNVNANSAANLLLADQFLTFYSGLAIGAIALLTLVNNILAIAAIVLAAVITPFVLHSYSGIANFLLEKLSSFSSHLRTNMATGIVELNNAALAGSLLVYIAHWLTISCVLALLFYPLLETEFSLNVLLLIAAIPLAMLAGFVALWAPAGIGVREAVIIAILSANLPLDLATSVALVYRLICVLNDVAMGIIALVYYGKDFASPEEN